MATLDWIFIAVLVASMLIGVWRGLVYEVLSAVTWMAAFFLAQWFAGDVAAKLPMAGASEVVRYAAGFLVVFVASVFAGGLIAFLMSKLMSAVGLGPMDRALGAMFGLVRGAVLLLSATVVVSMTPFKNSSEWQEATGVHVAQVVLNGLAPVLPQAFSKYLPS